MIKVKFYVGTSMFIGSLVAWRKGFYVVDYNGRLIHTREAKVIND